MITNRLTYRTGMDRYTRSPFTFFSPSEQNFFLRPQFIYRHGDRWSVTAGGNVVGGSDAHTFFKQLSDASNAYLRVRLHH